MLDLKPSVWLCVHSRRLRVVMIESEERKSTLLKSACRWDLYGNRSQCSTHLDLSCPPIFPPFSSISTESLPHSISSFLFPFYSISTNLLFILSLPEVLTEHAAEWSCYIDWIEGMKHIDWRWLWDNIAERQGTSRLLSLVLPAQNHAIRSFKHNEN